MSAFSTAVRPRPNSLTLPILGIGAGAACGTAAWWGFRHPKPALIVAMALVAATPFAIRGFQGRWDPFEPINLIALSLLVLFVARPIAELQQHLQPYPPYDVRPGFEAAMLIGLVSTATLYAAYFSRLGERLVDRLPTLPDRWDTARSVQFTFRLLAVGALLGLLFAAQIGPHNFLHLYTGRSGGGVGFASSSGYFEYGPYVAIPGSYISLVAWREQRSFAAGVALFICVGLSLLLTVPRGDRTFILAFAMPLIVMWYLSRDRRPNVAGLLLSLVVFVIAANVLLELRNTETRAQRGVARTIVHAIENPGHELSKFIAGADPSEFSVLEIEAHQYAIRQLPHWPGSTLISLAAGPVPHSLLGGSKPESPLQHVTYALFPSTTGSGSYGPSMFGAMYADDGWLSLILSSIAIGVAMRCLWAYFLRNSASYGTRLFFAGTLPLIVIMLRDDITSIFAIGVILSLPLVLCIRSCSRPARSLLRGAAA